VFLSIVLYNTSTLWHFHGDINFSTRDYSQITMDDSDDDYVDHVEEDEDFELEDGISRRTRTKDTAPRGGRSSKPSKLKGSADGYSWEDEYHRSWDVVQEDAGGSLAGVVAGIVEESKKKRIIKDTTPIQRGIIRNVILVLDFSSAMLEKDLRPNRYRLMLNYAIEFVSEFFDQNPISQLGIVGMRDGLAILVSELDSNPQQHLQALQDLKKQEPRGVPSLQNALEITRGLLYHVPSHCTKEVLIIFGALLSSDPGNIHKTIRAMVEDKIRARVIGLAAQVAICKELCGQTNYGDAAGYGIILNETHFKELFMEMTSPLAINTVATLNKTTLVEMGFPSKVSEVAPTLCSCHSKLTQGGYICPRCQAKICSLPALCPCCDLTLILSIHLARSYHHLFPLKNFIEEISGTDSQVSSPCYACRRLLNGTSSNARYRCPNCNNYFCIDCDVYCHETLHNCPGCESKDIVPLQDNGKLNHQVKPSKIKLKLSSK
jgi:transcription initiation factor TFIIH subunit 2